MTNPAPVALYCFPHESYFLEQCCPACAQQIPPLPRPHAADLSDLEPAWAAAVAREEAASMPTLGWSSGWEDA